MSLIIERPFAFYAFIPLIVALCFVLSKYRRMVEVLGVYMEHQNDMASFRHRFGLRTFFFVLGISLLIFAYSGISWGSRSVSVQKSGNAIAFVFDVSYSMQARDMPDGRTRLQVAADYAEHLLDALSGTSVSVVLAKGDAVLAVPLTDDEEIVRSLFSSLSPQLMTSAGSSLGKGIECAVRSFPPQSSQAATIWLFTDGEATDDTLLPALRDAIRYGISVSIIGFGSEQESEIVTGDGETKVLTALRSSAIKELIDAVPVKLVQKKQGRLVSPLSYVTAVEQGSAYGLLSALEGGSDNNVTVAYEIQHIERQNVFIGCAFVCFALAFLCGELNRSDRCRRECLALLCVMTMFCSCSAQVRNDMRMLEGHLDWNKKEYQGAIARFLFVLEDARARKDDVVAQYALYALASTYLMQDENDAALERFDQIASDAPEEVRFAVLYNRGVLAHRRSDYQEAAEYFKQALIIDSSRVDAKINLELSLAENAVPQKAQADSLAPVAENIDEQALEQAIYSALREKEQESWKSQEQEFVDHGVQDY